MHFPSTADFLKGKVGKAIWRKQKKQDITASQKDGKGGNSGLRLPNPWGGSQHTHGFSQSGNGRVLPLLKKVNITRPAWKPEQRCACVQEDIRSRDAKGWRIFV
jgi:hypothetical protein